VSPAAAAFVQRPITSGYRGAQENAAVAVARERDRTTKLTDDEKRMELTEHLGELRSRIMRSILYLIAGGSVCYFLFSPIYGLLFDPMRRALNSSKIEWRIVFPHFTAPFFVVLQVSIVAGAILTAPLIMMELWGFLSPALTREEKRPIRWAAPMSVILFLSGVVLAYWVARLAINWFLSYVAWFPKGAVIYQDPKTYVIFMLKLMAAFGGIFQLPVVLVFLAWIGILKAEVMRKGWRHAVVGISVIGLFITPSNDPFAMIVMIVPVIILYMGSIWLVAMVERRRERERR
jgi:sec-independent protein translocase protein TatC